MVADFEQSCPFEAAQGSQELAERYTAFEVATATNARAQGTASCRWRVQTRAADQTWSELVSRAAPTGSFDAISIWLKNPSGRTSRFSVNLQDADGVVYSAPPAALGQERNWYELAFRLTDYAPVSGVVDNRPGVTFPIRSISLLVQDLAPDQEYVLYFDALRVHKSPPARMDVVQLLTPPSIAAGEKVTVQCRLRAQSHVPAGVQVRIGLARNGALASEVTVPANLPARGVQPGELLPALAAQFAPPGFIAPGIYDVLISADNAQIVMPDRERLRTSQVLVTRQEHEPTRAAVEQSPGLPRIIARGKPLTGALCLTDLTDPRQMARIGQLHPSVIRFRIAIGQARPSCITAQWDGPQAYDFTHVDAALVQVLTAGPSAMLLPEIVLATPAWWLQANPGQQVMVARGTDAFDRIPHPSLSSPLWREHMGAALQAVVDHIEEGPFGDHIAGYQISAGLEDRWLPWELRSSALGDYSEPTRTAFQNWLQAKYGELPRLRAAWGQPVRPATDRPDAVRAVAGWAEIDVPSPTARTSSATWLLDPIARQPTIDYRLFASDATVDAIGHFAGIVKAAGSRRKLCGAAYGHFIQVSGEKAAAASGHLALARALALGDLDFLVAPAGDGIPGEVLMPAAAIAHAGKALIPHLGPHRSGAVDTLAAQVQYTGLPSLPDPPLSVLGLTPAEDAPRPRAEIAVIVDGMSTAYVSHGSPALDMLLGGQIRRLQRLGAPFDTWLLDDFVSGAVGGYRFYVFLNAFWTGDRPLNQALNRHLKPEDMALWLCAPGLIGISFNGRRVRDLTGIAASVDLKPGDVDVRIRTAGPVLAGLAPLPMVYGLARPAAPRLDVFDPEAEVLGVTGADRPALVMKRTSAGKSVLSVAPGVPAPLLRSLARSAGVHIYASGDDVLYVGPGFVAVHAMSAGERKAILRARSDVYAPAGDEPIARNTREFTYNLAPGGSALFLLRPPE